MYIITCMTAKYPAEYDTFRRVRNRDLTIGEPGDLILAEDHNEPVDAIEKIERTLGINPQGSFNTVRERLDYIESKPGDNLGNHIAEKNLNLNGYDLENVNKLKLKHDFGAIETYAHGEEISENGTLYIIRQLIHNEIIKVFSQLKIQEGQQQRKTILYDADGNPIIEKDYEGNIVINSQLKTNSLIVETTTQFQAGVPNKLLKLNSNKYLTDAAVYHDYQYRALTSNISVGQTETTISELTISNFYLQFPSPVLIIWSTTCMYAGGTDPFTTFRIYRSGTMLISARVQNLATNKATNNTIIVVDNAPQGVFTYTFTWFKETDGTAYINAQTYPTAHYSKVLAINLLHTIV